MDLNLKKNLCKAKESTHKILIINPERVESRKRKSGGYKNEASKLVGE